MAEPQVGDIQSRKCPVVGGRGGRIVRCENNRGGVVSWGMSTVWGGAFGMLVAFRGGGGGGGGGEFNDGRAGGFGFDGWYFLIDRNTSA